MTSPVYNPGGPGPDFVDPMTSQPMSPEPQEPKPFDAKSQIESFYQQNLGRSSDEGGLGSWLSAYQNGMSLDDINNAIRGSQEGQNYQTGQTINSFYNDALGRNAEQTGLDSWRNALQSGSSMDDIRNAIYGSQEAQDYRTPPADKLTPYPAEPRIVVDPARPTPPAPVDNYLRDDNGNVVGYKDNFPAQINGLGGGVYDPARNQNIPTPTPTPFIPGVTGDYGFATQQNAADPVYDFVKNIDQQLPYLQRAFQEQLQRFGDPVAAGRAVLGSLK